MTPQSPRLFARFVRHVPPALLTVAIFFFIFRRIPFHRLMTALGEADHQPFLALMIANAALYVAWDTFILNVAIRWFHGPVRYRDLLPVRAASYVVALLNTNLGRGALAAFLGRLLRRPFLHIGSTVIFLVLTEYTHLVAWATFGIIAFRSDLTRPLLWVPPAVAAFWLVFFAFARTRSYITAAPPLTSTFPVRHWLAAPWRAALLRTFRVAPPIRYPQIVLLRAPLFFVSLCLHYFAAPAFGISIPFGHLLTFLPVVFMVAALPITVARLGSTQVAWILLFGALAPADRLLAFSLAAHLTFALTRALFGLALLPWAYRDLVLRPPLPTASTAAVLTPQPSTETVTAS